ncbi:MAG: protein-glutamate methylesterase/protein-glutamine glutaminase [Spirochaetota bacterium]
MGKIRVLVVDDSAVVRQVLSEVLNAASDIEVIATAADPLIAHSRMQKEWPDVIITDIEMPRMNGITFIETVMAEKPTPIIVCSSYAGESASLSMRALAAGAVDVIAKPKVGVKDFLSESETMLVDAVRSAYHVNVRRIRPVSAMAVEPKLAPDVVLAPSSGKISDSAKKDTVVIIGASAGGTQAIEHILRQLPAQCPPVAIVQHMPEFFTKAFAERLNSVCRPEVKEAQNGDLLLPGKVIIAQGGRHMILQPHGNCSYNVAVKEGPLVSRHRPSVDILFRSAAKCSGENALGIILTGMGDDGAIGMNEMHDAGILTIAQSEESCAVFGMPKEAIRRGGVDKIISLDNMASEIMVFFSGRGMR